MLLFCSPFSGVSLDNQKSSKLSKSYFAIKQNIQSGTKNKLLNYKLLLANKKCLLLLQY